VVGCLLLLLFVVSPWVAALGFVVMVLSALLLYRYLGQLGRDQIRAMQQGGPLSMTGLIGRLAARFRPPPPSDE
jgi:membrane protein implicated in regulation of membrane protease activity